MHHVLCWKAFLETFILLISMPFILNIFVSVLLAQLVFTLVPSQRSNLFTFFVSLFTFLCFCLLFYTLFLTHSYTKQHDFF